MNKKIYLIRHGEIDYGNERRYIGITDLPLTNRGISQIQSLQDYFQGINIEKIYTSPLLRCRQTAGVLMKNKKDEYTLVDGLTEINMGRWENKTMASIKHEFPELYEARGKNMAKFLPPEGESFEELEKRVLPVFQRIVEETVENAMVIAHAGVNRIILAKLLELPLAEIFNIEQAYGCVTELTFQRDNKLVSSYYIGG